MKSSLRLQIVTWGLVLFSNLSVFAVDVAWEGYVRSRGNYFYNLDLNRDSGPNNKAYTDLRIRLNPSFFVTDKFRIKTSLNFLDGTLGDNPSRVTAYSNPAQSPEPLLSHNNTELNIGRSISALSSSSRGGILVPDGYIETTDLTPLQVRRAWAEFDLPYGTLKLGRMPHEIGMGIYANAGDEVDQEVGTTRDRILFDTAFGPYYVRPGIGWLTEGALERGADDFIEYFFHFGRKTENEDISIYLSYNNQGNYRSNDVTNKSEYFDRGSHYWVFDFYAQHKFELVDLRAEVVLFSGRAVGKELLAVNTAAKANWMLGKLNLLTEAGFSSGTDESNLANNEIKTVAFNRDYNVALILFEEALPSSLSDGVATAPHSGAISNAAYGRLKFSFDVAPFFNPQLNIVVPVSHKSPIGGAGHIYGGEYDLITLWPINNYFTADFSFGHFIPIEYYEDFTNNKNHSALLFRGGITAKF